MQNIYEAIRQRYDLIEVAESLGIRLKPSGNTYRGTLDGKDGALCIYPASQRWWDFHQNIGGDVTELVAVVKFGGDKSQAIRDLAPDFYHSTNYREYTTRYERFQQSLLTAHKTLMERNDLKQQNEAWEYLNKRGIPREYVEKMKIGLWCWYPNVWRISIPYWNSNMKEILYMVHRILPSGTEDAKYAKLNLAENPFLRNTIWGFHTLKRETPYLFITEGAFDAMRLDIARVSVLSSMGTTFGEENWKKVVRCAMDFAGGVILAYDTDEAGRKATYQSAVSLLSEGIPFYVVQHEYKDVAEYFEHGGTLEGLMNTMVKGYDWIAEWFTSGKKLKDLSLAERRKKLDEFKRFIVRLRADLDNADIVTICDEVAHYFPAEFLKEVKKEARKGREESDIADEILTKNRIIYHDRVGILALDQNRKVWRRISFALLKAVYVFPAMGKKYNYNKAERVAKLVRDRAFNDDFVAKLDTLPVFSVRNGTLHFNPDTGEVVLLPHNEADFVTHQAWYCYIESAECKRIKKALLEIFDDNTEQMISLQQAFGYVFFPDNRFQKAIVNMGVGGNGKSFVCELMKAMLGGENKDFESLASASPVSRLGKDFRLMQLKDSWINISGETDVRIEGAEANFKMIVGGDTVEDSYKGKDPIHFKSRSKLWLNCNSYPSCEDKTKGMARRFVFIDFPINFVDGEPKNKNERRANPNLLQELLDSPIEMAGLLNWAIEGFKSLVKYNGFIETKAQKKHMASFLRFNDPAISFIEENEDFFFADTSEQGIEKQRSQVYQRYAKWCKDNGEELLSARALYNALSNTARAYGSEVRMRQKHGLGWQLVIVRKLNIKA